MAKSNTKNKHIEPSKVGRPTKKDEAVVEKLESVLKLGASVETACNYAQIDKKTFYNWAKTDSNFSTRMESAKQYPEVVARNLVVNDMIKNKDVATAKWWLEKNVFKNQQQTNVQVNNFIPLLGGDSADVPENDSDGKDTQIIETY